MSLDEVRRPFYREKFIRGSESRSGEYREKFIRGFREFEKNLFRVRKPVPVGSEKNLFKVRKPSFVDVEKNLFGVLTSLGKIYSRFGR